MDHPHLHGTARKTDLGNTLFVAADRLGLPGAEDLPGKFVGRRQTRRPSANDDKGRMFQINFPGAALKLRQINLRLQTALLSGFVLSSLFCLQAINPPIPEPVFKHSFVVALITHGAIWIRIQSAKVSLTAMIQQLSRSQKPLISRQYQLFST
jgi:hypothetical protein